MFRKKPSFHAAYDKDGNIYGFYHDEDSPAPKEANTVKITDKKWQEILSNVPGFKIKGGKVVKVKK